MKIAVFSDIHANLQALQAVWSEIEFQRPDSVYCLGDLVGYGAHPNEVIDFVRRREIPTVMGNYDEGVGFDLHDCGCVYKNPADDHMGKLSLLWTRRVTSVDNKAYLRGLPLQIRLEDRAPTMLLVHGSPRKINEYLYEDRPAASFERLAKLAGTDLLLFGHTHLAYQKAVGRMLFVNSGSVGKPKDGDPRAGYVMLELGRRARATFHRVTYDVDAAASAIREADLPAHFADLLVSGGATPATAPAERPESEVVRGDA
jgi:putative phosphoesterase